VTSEEAPGEDDESSAEGADPAEGVLLRALEGPEGGWEVEVARACVEHPQHADTIRRRFARLRALGLDREASPAARERPGVPERIGDFRLLELLGSGGMGVVYLAEQVSLGRRVALKLIKGAELSAPRARERFRRETEAASRLDHPGICTVYEAGEAEGRPYIAMRYVAGESLARRIERAKERGGARGDSTSSGSTPRKELELTLELFEKTARALHAAHEAGLVHRDVKPGNVMVTDDGEPVILDFGLARLEGSEFGTLTLSGSTLGTPAYMSPEQVSAPARAVDRRTDVWSLGAALYEALALRRPFEAPTREDLYQRILTAPPPDPRRFNRRVSRELKVVLDTALDKDPARRYQSALDLAEDLRRIRVREPIRAKPAGAVHRTRRWVQRNPAGATLMTVLAGGLAVTLALLGQVTRERERARALALASASGTELANDPVLALLLAREAARLEWNRETRSRLLAALSAQHERLDLRHPSFLASAVFSPDGEKILTACNDANAHLWSGDGRLLLTLGPHEGQVRAALFSPDGSRILTAAENGPAFLWDAEGRCVAALPTDGGIEWGLEGYAASRAAAFSADGELVCIGSSSGDVALFDREGGRLGRLGSHEQPVLCVALSPDGRRVVSGARDGAALLWDRDGGPPVRLEHGGQVTSASFDPHGRTVLTSSLDGLARLWSLGGAELVTFGEHAGYAVRSARFSPDGRLVLTTGGTTARLWDLEGNLKRELGGNETAVLDADFSTDGRRVAARLTDLTVKVYDISGTPIAVLRGHQGLVSSVSFSPDGRRVVTSSHDGTARVWDVAVEGFPVLAHGLAVTSACFSPEGDRVATGSQDGTARIWDLEGDPQHTLDAGVPFTQLVWPPRGEELVSIHGDRTVRTWTAAGAEAGRHEVEGLPPGGGLRSVDLSGESRFLIGSALGVGLWEPRGNGLEEILRFEGIREPRAVALSPDARRVLAASSQSSQGSQVRLWASDGEPLWNGLYEGTRINAAAFSPGGERLLLGLQDATLRLLDARGEEQRKLEGHEKSVWVVTFSPRGDLLASGAQDGTARVWSLEGEEIVTLRHGGMLLAVAFSPSGDRLLTASSTGTARIWVLPDGELLARAGAATPRGFRATELARYGELLDGLAPAQPAVPEPGGRGYSPSGLNDAAWSVVREPGHTAAEVEAALLHARRASELRPDVVSYLNTVGVACYRAGRHEEALAILTEADARNRELGSYHRALDLFFLAMARQRLGEGARARRLLEEGRALLVGSSDPELAGILAEAEALIAGGGAP